MTARGTGVLVIAAIAVLCPGPIYAQSSASYRLDEQIFNAGGRPAQGVVSTSASFRLSLDSIGESITGQSLSGASFRLDGGMAPANRPPGEVQDLEILADLETLTWSQEPVSDEFNVYSSPLSTLPGGYGACVAFHITGTSWVDTVTPAPGNGLFYLVTGENRLRQEGTKGQASDGTVRGNPAPCP